MHLTSIKGQRQKSALMVGIEVAGVRPALATALFRDGNLSLARAARAA
jgi:hypothetical protein